MTIRPRAMTKTLHRLSLSWIAGWMALAPNLLLGRDGLAASDLYGQGVHAYMAGRSADAETLLSSAMAIKAQDPRLYYFRGLNRLRLGRGDDARSDMAAGAALEAEHPGRYLVGTALERVQGRGRLMLERFRREAREAAATTTEQQTRVRNEQLGTRDPHVLRQRVVIPLDELLRAGGPQPLPAEALARPATAPPRPEATAAPAAEAADDADPFRDDWPQPTAETPTPPAAEPAPRPAPPPAEIDDDPFRDF